MTVCIGTICDNGYSALVASDRMVTGNLPPIEFEHTKSKVSPLTNYCLALNSGNALKPIEIIPKIRSSLGKNPNIETIVDTSKEVYQYLRIKEAEEYLLKPRSLSSEIFYSRGASLFPPDLFNMIDHKFINFSYGLDLLIAGTDKQGAHIYTINNPGVANCFDTIGFNAIGVGELHALQVFIAHKYKISYNLYEAINIIYAAKRAAEVAPGVGCETDISLIRENTTINIDQNTIRELKNIYNETRKLPGDEIKEKSKLLKELMDKDIEKSKEIEKKSEKDNKNKTQAQKGKEK